MKKNTTISRKIRIYLTFIMIIFFIIMTLAVYSKFTKETQWWFDKACENKVISLSNHIEELVRYEDSSSIGNILKLEVEETKELSYLQYNYGIDHEKELKYGIKDEKKITEHVVDIEINNKKIGTLKAYFDKSIVIKKENQFLFMIIVGCTIFLIIFLILVKKIFKSILTNPVSALSKSITKVAQGDISVKVNYKSNDEIGELTNSFQEMMNSLREKDEFTSQMLDSTQAGVTLINAETHKIEYVNPLAEEMIGLDKEEIIGNLCHKFICPSQEGECPISDKGLTVYSSENKLLTADGTEKSILKTVKPIEICNRNMLIETFIDISELKQLQNQIKSNEKKYRNMFQNSSAAIIMTNEMGKIVSLNDRIQDWLGYDKEDFIGMSVLQLPFISKNSRKEIIEEHKKRAAGKEKSVYELEFFAKNGSKHIGKILVNVLKNEIGKTTGEIITILDITEKKRTEVYITKQENRFRSMFNSVSDAIYLMNKDKIIDCNSSAVKLYGMSSKQEFLNTELKDLFPVTQPDGSNSFDKSVEALKKTIKEGSTSLEWVIKTKSGKEITTELTATLIETDDEKFTHVSLKDISKRKQAESKLSERMKEIKALYKLSRIANRKDLKLNEFYHEVVYLIQETWQDPEHIAAKITINDQQISTDNWKATDWIQQADIRVDDELVGKIEVANVKEHSKNEDPPILDEERVLLSDIADRIGKIIERTIVEEKMSTLSRSIEASPVSIVITDNKGIIEYVNPKFTEVSGYTFEEVLGYNPRILKTGKQSSEFYKKLWDTITSGKQWSGEFCNKNKKGKIFWESASISPISNKSGEITHFVAVKEDITKRKEDEKLIEESHNEIKRHSWLVGGLKQLSDRMPGDLKTAKLSKAIVTFLAKYLNAQIGALYLIDEKQENLNLFGTYAYPKSDGISFKLGEGLIGEVAIEKEMLILNDVPDDYISVNSALGGTVPKHLIVSPFIYDDNVVGVIELASLSEFSKNELDFINESMKDIAVAINASQAREKVKDLLEKTIHQAEELQSKQDELRESNLELEEQAEELKVSSEKLKFQQEELQATNEELEEKTESLERQSKEIKDKNKRIEKARKEIEKKAEDLTIASKYKSEFLANMSHELRTPLNSLLILSKNLAENKKENLDNKQVESAEIIYNSGNDLLNLINEILDLSKVEAGKMTTNIEAIDIEDIRAGVNRNFVHQTKKKGLDLLFEISEDIPETINTDRQRVDQIIKNLISNALKFTEKGSITVGFQRPDKDVDLSFSGLNPMKAIAISITDTGIGIPQDKQTAIFEAFQQADGTTSRKFGGTGLGLSISKELSRLLGGELQLKSQEGKGSTFICYLPENAERKSKPDELPERRKTKDRRKKPVASIADVKKRIKRKVKSIEDDRNDISKEDKILLVIEDDLNFAKTLKSECQEKDFKFLHATEGETGLELASNFKPDGIILDIGLPGMSGWEVLDELKEKQDTRHIPVHVMSALDKTIDAFQKGAVSFLTKPVNNDQLNSAFKMIGEFNDNEKKRLLIIEDNDILRKSVIQLLKEDNLEIDDVAEGKAVIAKLHKNKYDCIILDLSLPDISGFDLLNKLDKDDIIKSLPPIIIYTGTDITEEEEFELRKYAKSIIIKGVKSEERLIDETALFLHQVVSDMPVNKQKIIAKLHNSDTIFGDKKILIVDDDMRNVFAVSAALEEKNMKITSAANGKKALEILEEDQNFDLILMDIMMPVMDGYETMGHIRKNSKMNDIPIIALTAKAMKGDKEKCIKAGANDYLTKPLNVDRLLSSMRVWLHK